MTFFIMLIRMQKRSRGNYILCAEISHRKYQNFLQEISGRSQKLTNTRTGDTLSVKNNPVSYARTDFSVPYTYMKYRVKNKGDEDKVSQALARMTAEDVTLRTVNDSENRQSLLYGMGEQHLEIVASNCIKI